MPNLEEFFHKPELIHKTELQKISGLKPCAKCDLNADVAFWDPVAQILSWECLEGHKNQVRVN